MFRKSLLVVLLLTLGAGVVWARDVDVSSVSISNVNVGAGTCTINYTLSRTNPTISTSQPVWVFVKYRLTTDTDYTGWQDTDNHTATDDASDVGTDSRNATVNANLTAGDYGIVTSSGSKSITWHWGGSGGIGSGTGLSSANSVRVRVYAIEMVKVGGGNYAMKDDASAYYRLTGTTAHSGSDYHLQKYPVTNKLYADFLNACANRHDPDADGDHDFWNSDMDNDTYGGIHITGSIPTASFAPENGHDDWPVVYATWYNAYDFCAWSGLDLPEEEHWYKVAGESQGTGAAVSDWYWGNTSPSSSLCNMGGDGVDRPSDVNDYESAVDGTDDGNVYGAYELAGNVWEWTDTYWYASGGSGGSTPYAASNGPTSYTDSSGRVTRGGDWDGVASWVRAGSRFSFYPRNRYRSIGFRAAKLP